MKSGATRLNLLILLASALLSYAIGETIVSSSNLLAYYRISRLTGTGRKALCEFYERRHIDYFVEAEPDPLLGFRARPYFKGTIVTPDVYVSVNWDRYGFAKGEAEKDSRIAVIGDSFSYGYGVHPSDTWSRRLEGLLNEPVSNFSTPGYTLWQYNAVMEEYPSYFSKKIILYGVYANDLSDEDSDISGNYYKVKHWDFFRSEETPSAKRLAEMVAMNFTFFERTILYNAFLKRMIKTWRPGDPKVLQNGIRLQYWGNELKEADASDESLERLFLRYEKANELAGKYGSVLVLILFPSKVLVFSKEYEDQFGDKKAIDAETRIRDASIGYWQKLGVEYVDPTSALERENEKGDFVYKTKDFHFNEHGNEVVAGEIARFLAPVVRSR